MLVVLMSVDSVLHALKLRKDISGQPDQCKVLLLYSLRNAADAIIAAKSSQAHERLKKVVADFEAVGETRTDSAKEICCDGGRLLWSLAGKLWNDGKKEDAARWIKKSAELLSAGASLEAASCWLAAGKSFQLAGQMDSALACVRKAAATDEADAILHLLELNCEQLKAGGESSEAWSCVEKLGKNPNLWRSQAARAAKATLEQPFEDLRLAGLELFVMCTAKDSQSDVSGLTMAAQLLTRVAELQRPVEDLRRLLSHAAQVATACDATLRQEFGGVERPGLAALRQLLATAWSKGQEFGESLQWTSAALMFEAGHQMLEILETVDPMAEGVDSARARDFMDVRIWFLVMDASARVQQAKDPSDPESLRYALTCLQNAHRLRRQSQELQSKGIQGEVPCSSSTWCQRRFLIMVLLEFEVRCLLGDPEQELRKFVDMAAKAEDLGARSLLGMSKIAAATSCRRLAFHCLKQYLCGLVSGGVLDYKQALPAYREMLSLNSCKNDSLPIFEGILNILGGSGNSKDPQYPKEEVKWLVATAWNTGAQFFRMQQYKWAERWMSKALALAKFCPGSFPPEKMTEGYAACLKHCA
eukprot:s1754_g8.t2